MKPYRYGKEVLVTGASSGIGLAATRLFSKKGYHVWALARHRGPEIENVTWIQADVTDPVQLKERLTPIAELGIVIHCAGFGISGSAEFTPLESARRQMEVNYFGVLNVNQAVLPLLRRNGKSLVLITSSVAGFIPIPFQSHYSSSKYAVEAYGEALAMEGRRHGIRVTLVEPGDTKTGFTASRTHDEPEDSPYFKDCVSAVKRMERDELSGKTPESVAKVFLGQASRRNPKVRVAVGFSYKSISLVSRLIPSGLRQRILGLIYS